MLTEAVGKAVRTLFVKREPFPVAWPELRRDMVPVQHVLARGRVPIEVLQEIEHHPATEQYGHSMILLVRGQVEISHLQGWVDEDLSSGEWQMSVLAPRQPLARRCCRVSPGAVPSNCRSARVRL